jgi:hypothetical protein
MGYNNGIYVPESDTILPFAKTVRLLCRTHILDHLLKSEEHYIDHDDGIVVTLPAVSAKHEMLQEMVKIISEIVVPVRAYWFIVRDATITLGRMKRSDLPL